MPDMQGVLASVYDQANNAIRVTAAVESILIAPGELSTTLALNTTNDVPTLTCPAAGTSSAYFNFIPPQWWAQMGVGFMWTRRGVEASNAVRWRVAVKKLSTGLDNVTEAFAADVSANITVPAQGVMAYTVDQVTNLDVTPPAFGHSLSIRIQREGDNAADTFTGAADLFGIVLRRNPGI